MILKFWMCDKCGSSGLIRTETMGIPEAIASHNDVSPRCSYQPSFVGAASEYITDMDTRLAAAEAALREIVSHDLGNDIYDATASEIIPIARRALQDMEKE